MKLSQEAVNDFIEIYKKEFGETLEYDDAELKANELLDLLELISTK